MCGAYAAIKASTSPDIAFGAAVTILIVCAAFQFIPWLRRGEGRYVPGLLSEVLLLCPLAVVAVWRAVADGGLSARGILFFAAPLIASLFVMWVVAKKSSVPAMPPGPFGD